MGRSTTQMWKSLTSKWRMRWHYIIIWDTPEQKRKQTFNDCEWLECSSQVKIIISSVTLSITDSKVYRNTSDKINLSLSFLPVTCTYIYTAEVFKSFWFSTGKGSNVTLIQSLSRRSTFPCGGAWLPKFHCVGLHLKKYINSANSDILVQDQANHQKEKLH